MALCSPPHLFSQQLDQIFKVKKNEDAVVENGAGKLLVGEWQERWSPSPFQNEKLGHFLTKSRMGENGIYHSVIPSLFIPSPKPKPSNLALTLPCFFPHTHKHIIKLTPCLAALSPANPAQTTPSQFRMPQTTFSLPSSSAQKYSLPTPTC